MWPFNRNRATVDPRGVSKSASDPSHLAGPPMPLRDVTGSHWVQLLRRHPDLIGVVGYLGQPDWLWCCTICRTLSLPSTAQTSADPAPHLATPEHQARLETWDGEEDHACVRLEAPVVSETER